MAASGREQTSALLKILLDERLLFTPKPTSARYDFQRWEGPLPATSGSSKHRKICTSVGLITPGVDMDQASQKGLVDALSVRPHVPATEAEQPSEAMYGERARYRAPGDHS